MTDTKHQKKWAIQCNPQKQKYCI